jgi:hypothetical protein
MPSSSRWSPARALALVAVAATSLAARDLSAQAWFYPSFQTPQIADREYNFAVVAAGGADFLFQWREGIAPRSQLSLDAGIADGEGPSNPMVFFGGQWARELARATEQQPIDLLVTAGAGLAVGNGPGLFRIPVGLSVGHRFPLDRDMWITPYVHPRASLDVWTSENAGNRLTLDFDIGGKLEITRELALRASVVVSGHDAASSAGFGIGLSWAPLPLGSTTASPRRTTPR